MTAFDRDYLPSRDHVEFPPELALLIIRKAGRLATSFEERAIDEMTRDVRRALRDGADAMNIVRQMQLTA